MGGSWGYWPGSPKQLGREAPLLPNVSLLMLKLGGKDYAGRLHTLADLVYTRCKGIYGARHQDVHTVHGWAYHHVMVTCAVDRRCHHDVIVLPCLNISRWQSRFNHQPTLPIAEALVADPFRTQH